MKITLRNDFHNSEAIVITKDGRLSARQVKRADRKLCGISDCCCGGIHRDGSFETTSQDGSGRVEVEK